MPESDEKQGREIGNGAGVHHTGDEVISSSDTATDAIAQDAADGCRTDVGLEDLKDSNVGVMVKEKPFIDSRTRLRTEFSSIIALSLPIVITSVLNFIMNIVDLAMVGHLGKEQLAAASLGLAYYNTVYFPLSGVAMALDTLFSQAYGAKNYSLYAMWLLAGSLCISIISIFISVILLFAERVLIGIQMEVELSQNAGAYVAFLIPGMFANIGFSILQKYLQSQGILAPCVYIAAISNVFNIAANYYLIYVTGMGLQGAPIATSVTRIFQFIAVLVYLKKSSRHALTWPTAGSFKALRRKHLEGFMALGSTGWLMIALEAWAFDLGQLLAGYLDYVSLGAHSAMQTVSGFTYMSFPLALSIAVSIRVGQLLGAGDYEQAQVAARVTVILTVVFMATIAVIFVLGRNYIGFTFSSDADVVATFAAIIPIAALFQVFDGLQSACAGAFRGMGRNKLVVLLNFVGLWLIGQTLGISLTFFTGTPLGHGVDGRLIERDRGIGIYGLWWGLAAGLGCTSVTGFWILTYRTNWPLMAKEAHARSAMDTHMADTKENKTDTELGELQ